MKQTPNDKTPALPGLGSLCCALAAAALLSACVVTPAPPPHYVAPRPAPVYEPTYAPAYAPEAPDAVVSVYIDPPLYQPPPIAVTWAPPPMLVEAPPPQPYPDAVWTGGYWAWQGRWVWSAGRWSAPPRPAYVWVQPYYEHRADTVVFVPGFWSPPEVRFVPPPAGLSIALAVVAAGVLIGHPPMGPQGVFVPPPPGSRPGIIVPAPIGTPPAVVISAPPVVNVGMRIRGNVEVGGHDTTVNDNRVTNNVTNITNVTNVTIVAPPGATANGQAFQSTVPARAHLAAAMTPMVRAMAPKPASGTAIPSYVAGRAPVALPAAQRVNSAPVNAPGAIPNGASNGAQRPDRTEPADHGDHGDHGDRANRGDLGDRANQAARPDGAVPAQARPAPSPTPATSPAPAPAPMLSTPPHAQYPAPAAQPAQNADPRRNARTAAEANPHAGNAPASGSNAQQARDAKAKEDHGKNKKKTADEKKDKKDGEGERRE